MNRNIRDGLNFASKLTPQRILNATEVVSSYNLSRLTGKVRITGLPISISIEPTTSCNLRCPECPSGLRSFTRPTGMLDEQLFQSTIDQLANHLTYLIFYFQGEPYLHPKLLSMVEYASSKGIYTATSTNAHFLSDELARKTVESGLDRLIISIDGTDQKSYESYRVGGRLEKVLESASRIHFWKKKMKSRKPHTVFQFLVVRQNEHQVEEVHRLARQYQIDAVALKTAQIYDYENGSDLIPTIDKYSRYRKLDGGRYAIKNQWLNHCWKMWHSCVITWDGSVLPCCFDKDAHFVLGDMKQETFEKIWFGEKYNDFRQSLLQSRAEIEMCRNCTEGTKVWA